MLRHFIGIFIESLQYLSEVEIIYRHYYHEKNPRFRGVK